MMYNLIKAKSCNQDINITDLLTQFIELIIHQTDIFNHIDINRILVCVASNRKNSRGCTFGKLVPLKFKGGYDVIKYRNRHYAMPRIMNNSFPLLYVIYFYMPKFFDLSSIDKLKVIFHELYHISPEFNGDIRRMGRVKASHGSSKDRFDSFYEEELKRFYYYISQTQHYNFLKMDTNFISEKFNKIYCRRMKLPKPIAL